MPVLECMTEAGPTLYPRWATRIDVRYPIGNHTFDNPEATGRCWDSAGVPPSCC